MPKENLINEASVEQERSLKGDSKGAKETQKVNNLTSSEENIAASEPGKSKFYLVKTSTGSFLVPMSARGLASDNPDSNLPAHVAEVISQAKASKMVNQAASAENNQTVSSNLGDKQSVSSDLKSTQIISDVSNKQGKMVAERIDLGTRSGIVTRRRAPYITHVDRSTSSESSSTSGSRSVSESELREPAERSETDNAGQTPENISDEMPPGDSCISLLKRAAPISPEPSPPCVKQPKSDEIPVPETKFPDKSKSSVPEKTKSSSDRIKELKERLKKQQEKLEEVRKRNISKINLEEFDNL